MKNSHATTTAALDRVASSASEDLRNLLAAPLDAGATVLCRRIDGVVIGSLVGFAGHGATPLVTFPGQPTSAAQAARSTRDLQAAHIGRQVVLMFEDGDPARPIVLGCLSDAGATAPREVTEHVEVDADGQQLVVSAKERIVLRCGKASITLTKEGKVILQGAYVSHQSSGVLRIKGGSVHIN